MHLSVEALEDSLYVSAQRHFYVNSDIRSQFIVELKSILKPNDTMVKPHVGREYAERYTNMILLRHINNTYCAVASALARVDLCSQTLSSS